MSDKKVNKVVYDGETLIDLTGDSVTPETLAEGETAHDASGEQIVGTMVQSDGGPYLPLKNNEKKAVSHYFEVKTGGDTSWIKIDTNLNKFVVSHSVEFLDNINIQDNVHISGKLTADHVVTDHCEVATISSISNEPITVINPMKTMSLRPIEGSVSVGYTNERYNTIYAKKVDTTEYVVTPKIRPPIGTNYLRFITYNNVTPDVSPDPLPVEWGGTGKNRLLTAADVGAVPTNRTVNGKALSSNINLGATDVSALPITGGTVTGKTTFSGGLAFTSGIVNNDNIQLLLGFKPYAQGGTVEYITATSLATLLGVSSDGKIATGSWVGTGTFGIDNPTTIITPFQAKFIWIFAQIAPPSEGESINPYFEKANGANPFIIPGLLSTTYSRNYSLKESSSGTSLYIKKSDDGKTIQFYDTGNARMQFNAAGHTWYWIAFI